MIKQALNAPTIANIMRRFTKDDAIKLLGKSTYNKWLKKLPADSIASDLRGRFMDTPAEIKMFERSLRDGDAYLLQRAQDVSNALMHRYGPGFESNLPRVNNRLDTRGRLKGRILKWVPRVNYLHEFAKRNNLISRDELLRRNRNFKAGLDPKTLTSEWYTLPTAARDENNVVDFLHNPRHRPEKSLITEKKYSQTKHI